MLLHLSLDLFSVDKTHVCVSSGYGRVCVRERELGQRILFTALKVETVQSGTITDSGPERRWRL